jgi:Cu/Ag efflux protein CusF
MRKLVITAAAFAFVAVATVANAAEVTGSIKAIDTKASTITLSDGKTYQLVKTIKIADLKVGEKVKVIFDTSGKTMTATKVEAAK